MCKSVYRPHTDVIFIGKVFLQNRTINLATDPPRPKNPNPVCIENEALNLQPLLEPPVLGHLSGALILLTGSDPHSQIKVAQFLLGFF